MGVDIAWDQDKRVAVMYDDTSGRAFGPIFTGVAANVEAGDFLDWLKDNPPHWAVATVAFGPGTDPRSYKPDELERLVQHWWELQTYVGGPDA